MKTYFPKGEQANEERKWVVVDATGLVVGRLASKVAAILRGKTKVTFTPHADNGDFVVVVNADKVVLTGAKASQKLYRRYTGFIAGLKEVRADKMLQTHPERVIEHAVQGMLPKSPLGRAQLTKLKIYKGSSHPHAAQQPESLSISN